MRTLTVSDTLVLATWASRRADNLECASRPRIENARTSNKASSQWLRGRLPPLTRIRFGCVVSLQILCSVLVAVGLLLTILGVYSAGHRLFVVLRILP